MLLLFSSAGNAIASVVVGTTRVIYPLQEREVSVRLTNAGDTPALVSAWADRGDPNEYSDANPPFVLSPPMFRMEPRKDQVLRMIRMPEQLPLDRESVYWLNVVEVPPESERVAEGLNGMQLALRIRIKIFVRPPKLVGQQIDAPPLLQWKIIEANGKQMLSVRNPTSYHVSFSEIAVGKDADKVSADITNAMVAPGATLDMPLSAPGITAAAIKAGTSHVYFQSIDDYGVPRPFEATLTPSTP